MLTQAEANLAALIESTADLIWSVDLDYRIIASNCAFRENIENNYGNSVLTGMRPEEYLPPEKAALWPPLYEQALREGPFRTEYLLVDGRTLEMALNPIVMDGQVAGISVFGKDITERKAADCALRQAEEAPRPAGLDRRCLHRPDPCSESGWEHCQLESGSGTADRLYE